MTEKKIEFVKHLAEYLVKDQAKMSMLLGMGDRTAVRWAAMRNLTPLHGYPTVEEAEKILTEWLWPQ